MIPQVYFNKSSVELSTHQLLHARVHGCDPTLSVRAGGCGCRCIFGRGPSHCVVAVFSLWEAGVSTKETLKSQQTAGKDQPLCPSQE